VLDEAYQEFASTDSMTAKLRTLPNLVILRTLSKAWGLAGARCGFTLGHPALISVLQRIRAPYPMSCATVRLVERIFNRAGEAKMRRSAEKLIAERRKIQAALERLPGVERVYPSEANFLLVKVRSSRAVLERAKRSGILLRDRGSETGLTGCIRVSVGTPMENRLALASFREALG